MDASTNKLWAFVKKAWLIAGHLDLAVVICFFLALDTAFAYPLVKKSLYAFVPLGDVGLVAWLTTYGWDNISRTFWFYGLAIGLVFLGINAFCCSTARVWAILKPSARKKGWFLKLGPHVMHYAVLAMVLGYLGSYTLALALPGRALVPGGPPLKLPGDLGSVSVRVENPVVYQGQRLEFFQDWFLDPGFILTFKTPDGQAAEKPVAYNRPARHRGYNFYLADFYPKSAASGGMGSYKTVQLTVRRDPAAAVYLIGIAVFAIGVAMYVADLWLTRQRRGPKDPKPMAG